MNKQQLASTIWQSANQMRSKIEANEYKDYILGFMFYKYLSDREISFLKGEKYSDEDIKKVTADDEKLVKHISENIGYFIAYEDLFSSWLSKGDDFDVSDVRDALSNFDANIEPTYKKLFENIFKTLQSGLSKLGETSTKQTKSIKALLKLIKRIPMDGKQDYDVLGFIYEYLISMFAANAGKKAGEFYTPHEVSVLMSEIVANHLKDREHIKIYDPTSGSGSLLINIGASMAQYIEGENKIDYYAQELKENTYNLTRMNLVMRGINPANINVRNGDTLEDDWPFFETDENKDETYSLVKVDAVVSNPPYSQKWDPKNKEFDPRFKEFGVAPKAKADYAFLLHELYHLEDDGIMTIVLPHGVLFRGGEEETIRKTLIERNHIEAIIGLPANIFFGTGIPTIIMVLKRTRSDSDILIIDASKKFEKVGKNNKLRARDIREIVDTLKARKSVTKFAKLVTKDDIRKNEYNLNIPRYVDSSDDEEPWDIHAIVMDVDNDHTDEPLEFITEAKMDEMFPDIDYCLVPSRHHMLPKGSHPAAPRFHVIFPVEAINNADEYAKVKEVLYKKYPFFDGNVLDAAKFLFGCDVSEVTWHEGWMSIMDDLSDGDLVMGAPEEDEEFDAPAHSGPILEGSRNKTLNHYAYRDLCFIVQTRIKAG